MPLPNRLRVEIAFRHCKHRQCTRFLNSQEKASETHARAIATADGDEQNHILALVNLPNHLAGIHVVPIGRNSEQVDVFQTGHQTTSRLGVFSLNGNGAEIGLREHHNTAAISIFSTSDLRQSLSNAKKMNSGILIFYAETIPTGENAKR